jgi:hypothetical protein
MMFKYKKLVSPLRVAHHHHQKLNLDDSMQDSRRQRLCRQRFH